VQGTNLNLIDEYQLCIHPVIAGKGLPLLRISRKEVCLRYKNQIPWKWSYNNVLQDKERVRG
jgi:hypothetical protein